MYIIPYEVEYRDFLENHASYNSICSGIPSCDHCMKKSYYHRSKYLNNYLSIFFKNLEEIKNNNYNLMPKLEWCAAKTTEIKKCGELHNKHCNNNKSIKTCDCNLATFLKCAYGINVSDEDEKPSLKIIYDYFKKHNKNRLKII